MKNLKSRLIVGVLALIITTAVVAGVSRAQDNGGLGKFGRFWHKDANLEKSNMDPEKLEEMKAQMAERRTEMQAKQEQIQAIFENEDYAGWQALMQERLEQMQKQADDFEAKINEDTFAKMVEIHELMGAGDMEGARALREQLDIGPRFEFGRCKGHMMHGLKE